MVTVNLFKYAELKVRKNNYMRYLLYFRMHYKYSTDYMF